MSTGITAVTANQSPGSKRSRWRPSGALILLAVGSLVWVLPFFLLVLSSIRPLEDFLTYGPISLPRTVNLDNFFKAWNVGHFATTYRNSLIITAVKVPLGVFLSAMMAFALAKMRLRFR